MTVHHVKGHACQPSELDDLMDTGGRSRQLEDRAEGKDERQQHHARAQQANQEFQRRAMPVGVTVFMTVIVSVPGTMGVIVAMTMIVMMVVLIVHMLHSGRNGHVGGRLRIELFAEKKHQDRPAQGKQRNQPNLVEKVHTSSPINSRSYRRGTGNRACLTI